MKKSKKNAVGLGKLEAKFKTHLKSMKGDTHFVAMGMAVGVFVGITPTIPFHTLGAVLLAYIFKGSRSAAILGMWVSNPFTLVFLYLACYKTGMLLFGSFADDPAIVKNLIHQMNIAIPLYDKMIFILHFVKTKVRVCLIMLAGGFVLGVPAAVVSYFVTRRFMIKIHLEKTKKLEKRINNELSNDLSRKTFKVS